MTTRRTANVGLVQETTQADAQHKELINKLAAQDVVRSSEVQPALRAVPRHLLAIELTNQRTTAAHQTAIKAFAAGRTGHSYTARAIARCASGVPDALVPAFNSRP